MIDPEKDLNEEIEDVETEGSEDVLEKVMDGIEMAGESLDFFEGEEDEGADNAEEEIDANSEDFLERDQAVSVIESLLFSSDRPIGIGTFKQVFKGTNIKTKDIKKLLEDMQSLYAESTRGVSLEEINGGWQLRTKVDNMDFLRKLAKARPFKLSGPALEVLAIIAYKQPLVKSEVDQIRGVESGHLVRALMEKGLVCFQGKSELPGKPMQYGTTRKFLEIFGLRNLRELPSLDEIDQLLPDGIGIEEEDEKLSDVTESMSENYVGNYSEGEEELEKITGTLSEIDTSSEFFEEEKRRQKVKRDRDRARDIQEALDVGEEVDPKDVRWFERYQAKLEEELAAKAAVDETESEASETMEAADTEVEAGPEFSEELVNLSEESLELEASPMEVDELDEALADDDDEFFDSEMEDEEE
ncbi:MAG: SMC-Scp complex subunit ScpB [Bdellovibrionales bacterium]|nr:SMC-Scp complex subunit ScpB [Bdellovibrionales bacterium]